VLKRLVLSQVLESPNVSYPWIQFMAFHIELGDVAKARATAERALQIIHFRQAQISTCKHFPVFSHFPDGGGRNKSCMHSCTPAPAIFSPVIAEASVDGKLYAWS